MNYHYLDDNGKELLLSALYLMLLSIIFLLLLLCAAMYKLILGVFFTDTRQLVDIYFVVLVEATFSKPIFYFSTNCARAQGGDFTMEILFFWMLTTICGYILTIFVLQIYDISEHIIALTFCLWRLFGFYFGAFYHYFKMFSGYNLAEAYGSDYCSIKLNFRITSLFTRYDRHLMYKEFLRFFLVELEAVVMKTAILIAGYRHSCGNSDARSQYLLFSYYFLLYYMQLANLINYSTISFASDFNPRAAESFEALAKAFIKKSYQMFCWYFLVVGLFLFCLPSVYFYFSNRVVSAQLIRYVEAYSNLFRAYIICIGSSLFVSPYYIAISFFQQAYMLVPVVISVLTLTIYWAIHVLQASFQLEHPNILRFIMYQEMQKFVYGLVFYRWIVRMLARAVASERLDQDYARSSNAEIMTVHTPGMLPNASACTYSTGSIFMTIAEGQ